MKKTLLLLVCVFAMGYSAQAQTKFGAGASFLDGLFGVGARAHNSFTEDFAGQASFHYYFESLVNVYSIDLDVHYSGFDLGDVESFAITPFAGLNFFRAAQNGIGGTNTNLNVGVNGTMPLTDTLDLYIEPKFIIGRISSFGVSAGVYF